MIESLSFRNEPQPHDVRSVADLVRDTGFFRPDEIKVAAELVEERLQKGEESGYYFSLADNPEHGLAGYACFGPTPCAIGTFDLYWIVVAKCAQGQGLGLALDQKAADACRAMGGRKIYVETSGKEQYAPTRAFYLRAGYAEAAVLKDFYDRGDDKVIFQKDL